MRNFTLLNIILGYSFIRRKKLFWFMEWSNSILFFKILQKGNAGFF